MGKFSFTARFDNWHHLRPNQTLVPSMCYLTSHWVWTVEPLKIGEGADGASMLGAAHRLIETDSEISGRCKHTINRGDTHTSKNVRMIVALG